MIYDIPRRAKQHPPQYWLSRATKRKAGRSGEVDEFIELHVSLPSGRSEIVTVPRSATIADLRIAAQESLEQRFLRLVGPGGRLLDPTDSVALSGLQDGGEEKRSASGFAFVLR